MVFFFVFYKLLYISQIKLNSTFSLLFYNFICVRLIVKKWSFLGLHIFVRGCILNR